MSTTLNKYDVCEETTFNELTGILKTRLENICTITNTDEQAGSDFEKYLLENSHCAAVDANDSTEQKVKKNRRPGAVYLRMNYPIIAKLELQSGGCLEVFENGYAVYDNGNRKTVLWVLDCGSASYYFTPLKDAEKKDMPQYSTLDENELGALPWFDALIIAGENRIEYNLEHPKSEGTTSDYNIEDIYDKTRVPMWCGPAHFENPEEAYLRKEAQEARIAMMTDKQREVYELYFDDGYTLREIADRLQISFRTVADRIDCIKAKLKKKSNEF